jgi:molybdenum cofactor guanylyltransferase
MTAVLILTGGKSSRMGRDKATLNLQGQSLLQWQRGRFERAGFDVVSGLQDHFTDHRGPLAGIHTACLARTEVPDWLVIPVDMPQYSIAAAQHLIEKGQQAGKPVSYRHNPMPLYLPVSDSLVTQLTDWLKDPNGRRSVYALIERFDGLWLDDQGLQQQLTNINTPAQWQSFLDGVSL